MAKRSLIALTLLLMGCQTIVAGDERTRAAHLLDDWRQQNRQTSLALGERVFPHTQSFMLKAIIASAGNLGLAVLNLDREIGFAIAEGTNVLSPEVLHRNWQRKVQSTGFAVSSDIPSNVVTRITYNLFPGSNGATKLKIGITAKSDAKIAIMTLQESIFPPGIYSEMHRVVWAEIDRAVFLQRNLDLPN